MYRNFSSKTRIVIKLLLDALAVLAAIVFAFYLRFYPDDFNTQFWRIAPFIPAIILIRLFCFYFFRTYSSMWRYASLHTFTAVIQAAFTGTMIIIVLGYFIKEISLPRTISAMEFFFVVFFANGLRLSVRYWNTREKEKTCDSSASNRVLIYGAGDAGEQLARNIVSYPDSGVSIVGFLDDDPRKKGQYIHNIKVLGGSSDIGTLVKEHNIREVYFCIPSLSGSEARGILNTIKSQVDDAIEIKTIPGLTDLVDTSITFNQLRKIELTDLLRRKQITLNREPVGRMIKGKTVLVAGGGGSIGLELCKQIATFNPRKIVIVDNCEFNTYNAENTIKTLHPTLEVIALVADACQHDLIERVFKQYKPELVFHAAAYKHVPLMEVNPWAAVYNNLMCTLELASLSCKYRVDRFILISSDKAVHPSSVMGATKRICEMMTIAMQRQGITDFISVRFGNVLGSSGSVIPKFKEQIEKGGPITITHPEMKRYFMLIPEAVELVLQAGASGEAGKVFVLDMGEPIRIVDLAEYMIKLSGLKKDHDIQIVYSGLRLGEKLYEDLYFDGEEVATDIPNLLVLNPKVYPDDDYVENVERLLNTYSKLDDLQIRIEIKKLVPEYSPPEYQLPEQTQPTITVPVSNTIAAGAA